MNHALRNTIASIIALLLAGACVTEPPKPVPLEERLAKRGLAIGQQVKVVTGRRINGWSNVGQLALIVNVDVSQKYLVTVRTSCEDGLRSAQHVIFSTTSGNFTDKDKLIIQGSGRYKVQCYIDTIHILEKVERTDNGN